MNPLFRKCYAVVVLALCITACGGGGGGAFNGDTKSPPAVPTALAANAGDGAVSIGWTTPASGSPPFSYSIIITPNTPAAATTISGNAAVVRNLGNGTQYTFTLKASNSAGDSPAANIQSTPLAPAATSTFTRLNVLGDSRSASGIYDPSLLRASSTDVWMAYSSVQYYGSPLVQDVSTSLARSTNGGSTFNFVQTLGAAGPAIVTDSDPAKSACGTTQCAGRWVYETPWLIDDSSETNTARRFKLFAHKYFLLPGRAQGATLYHLGAIVMWTAPALTGAWSAEKSVIGWNLTPGELMPFTSNVNSFSGASNCLVVGEGSAALTNQGIDFVFNCPFTSGNTTAQKIVMLRSTDHANSFEFVSTLLQPADASTFANAKYFSAPSIISSGGNAQALMVTPVVNRSVNNLAGDFYSGCVIIPFADTSAGTLMRDGNNIPLSIASLPTPLTPVLTNHLYGACAWDRGVTATGILMNDVAAQSSPIMFTILSTQKSL